MTYEQFWYGDPSIATMYRKAHYEAIKNRNYELWLQGRYNYEAVYIAISNAFRKKGTHPANYAKKPYEVLPKTEKEIRKEQEREKQNIINSLDSIARNFNSRHKQGDMNGN